MAERTLKVREAMCAAANGDSAAWLAFVADNFRDQLFEKEEGSTLDEECSAELAVMASIAQDEPEREALARWLTEALGDADSTKRDRAMRDAAVSRIDRHAVHGAGTWRDV